MYIAVFASGYDQFDHKIDLATHRDSFARRLYHTLAAKRDNTCWLGL
jgi:hypothetical protein